MDQAEKKQKLAKRLDKGGFTGTWGRVDLCCAVLCCTALYCTNDKLPPSNCSLQLSVILMIQMHILWSKYELDCDYWQLLPSTN